MAQAQYFTLFIVGSEFSDYLCVVLREPYNYMEFELIAKTFMGLESILAQELNELGAKDVQAGRRVVSFKGDKEMMYRANFQLRTAIRILKPILHFKAKSADDVYEEIKKLEWQDIIGPGKTFSVDSVVYSDEFNNSRFVTYKVKDAIVDYFREKTGKRPNISITNPDILLHIHISDTDATLSLDSSGASLHRRGYRQESVEAPLNEVLAAGMILMTGWKGETDFIDPMCGSGTLPIEAALIACNMAPGLFRKGYAFEKWPDFDADLFESIYNDDSREKEFEHHIYGYDVDIKAVNTANLNVKAAGLTKYITVKQQDFKDFTQPAEKSIIVTNPPYGERISTPDLLGTYKMIGERLKHAFTGNEAWILSYKEECFRQIGLKPSLKIPLYNGSLECEYRKYQMFDGKINDFVSDGGHVKTEEEKRIMAEKARGRKNREYKKLLDEQEENEEADIRSFTFHSLERRSERKADGGKNHGNDRREHRDNDRRERRDRDDKRQGDFRKNKDFKGSRDRKDSWKSKDSKPYRKSGGQHDRRDNFERRKKIFDNED